MNQRGKISLMLFCFSICGTAALVTHFIQVREARPIDLYEVIRSQLAACRAEDFPRAYRQASNGFQQKFNLAQFAEMIRTEYSGMARARRIEFGAVEQRGRHAVIQVFFVGRNEEVVPCLYSLVNEGDGWKIDGARLMKRWPTGQRLAGMRS